MLFYDHYIGNNPSCSSFMDLKQCATVAAGVPSHGEPSNIELVPGFPGCLLLMTATGHKAIIAPDGGRPRTEEGNTERGDEVTGDINYSYLQMRLPHCLSSSPYF